jgi:hypothetical protein
VKIKLGIAIYVLWIVGLADWMMSYYYVAVENITLIQEANPLYKYYGIGWDGLLIYRILYTLFVFVVYFVWRFIWRKMELEDVGNVAYLAIIYTFCIINTLIILNNFLEVAIAKLRILAWQ